MGTREEGDGEGGFGGRAGEIREGRRRTGEKVTRGDVGRVGW